MASSHTAGENRPNLRLWPGVAIVVLQWLVRYALPVVIPESMPYGVMASLLCGVLLLIWWAFFSRAPRLERWGGTALIVATLAVTPAIIDESMATGMMGMLFFVYAIPLLSLALVAWAVLTRHWADGPRRLAMVATILLACGSFALLRTGGFNGAGDSDFAWRWSATAEDRLLAQTSGTESGVLAAVSVSTAAGDMEVSWAGFRGPGRDGVSPRAKIGRDWSAAPPVELWRRPIGPAWSSFAVAGELIFTQEQRGEDELVSAFRADTGEPVWQHRDPVRFWESNAGAGPRGTPFIADGQLYAFGATGLLNALDARDGSLIWSRDVAADTGVKTPGWGFSSSPLVVDDLVIVAAAGTLAGYDRSSGEARWTGPDGKYGYSSPQLVTIDGVEQVLLMNGVGATSVSPTDGQLLWQHPLPSGTRIVQPAILADGGLLVSEGDGSGMRRLEVSRQDQSWNVEERWTTIRLKPYFSDFVVHQGHAYGFDGRLLAAIDIETGERRWKGGRYGQGQLILEPESGLLLVLTEDGELALVEATPGQFTELGTAPAIEGKTWNHPVIVGDLLLVRNDREMAAFRLG